MGRTKAVNAERASVRSGLGSAANGAVTAGLSPLQLRKEVGRGLHAPARLSLRPQIPLRGGRPAPCLSHHGKGGGAGTASSSIPLQGVSRDPGNAAVDTHTLMRTCTHIHSHTSTHTHSCTRTLMHMHTHMRAHAHSHTRTRVHTLMHAHAHTHSSASQHAGELNPPCLCARFPW